MSGMDPALRRWYDKQTDNVPEEPIINIIDVGDKHTKIKVIIDPNGSGCVVVQRIVKKGKAVVAEQMIDFDHVRPKS